MELTRAASRVQARKSKAAFAESPVDVIFHHMTGSSHSGTAELQALARRLALAVDVIEARLDQVGPGAAPDDIAKALEDPVRVFDEVAKEATS